MKSLLALLLLASTAFAAPSATVSLAWDPSPPADQVTTYSVYEQTGATWTKVGTATAPSLTLANVAIGAHTYAVTATNAAAESLRSNTVAVNTAPPAAPTGVRVITITVSP